MTEAVIGKVTIQGNQQFSQANVRAAMPHLQEDKAPNMLQLSENVQLANENPAKQVQLVLGVSDKEGQVDARLEITEDDPQRIYLTLDDTGVFEEPTFQMGTAQVARGGAERMEFLGKDRPGCPDQRQK